MVKMLMRAAARILVRDGYDALTTNRVAEEAGASVGSLYQYFASKEALVAALLEDHLDSTMHMLRQEAVSVFAMPVEQAVRRFVELMFESHRVDPELHRVFAEQLPRVGDFAKIEAIDKEAEGLVQAYLEAHAREIVPQNHALSAFVLVSTIEALTHRAVMAKPRKHDDAELMDEITRLVAAYLLPAKATRIKRAAQRAT
jgi:AcrR family transcriptional regulator